MHLESLWALFLGVAEATTQPAESVQLNASAVWVIIAGLVMLFGGMFFCIGVAWFHAKEDRSQKQVWDRYAES
jgi:hypothetical protein